MVQGLRLMVKSITKAPRIGFGWFRVQGVTLQKCEAVPRRARIEGSYTCASLNSRLESNKEEVTLRR